MTYRIHPGIGVARVGSSEDYYVAPEQAGALPINVDGRPFVDADFRDAQHRLKRQGARFDVFTDAADGTAVPVRPGHDGVERIEWTVHLANKKGSWYEFYVGAGETGYAPDHALRNAHVVGRDARTALFIDAGPRTLTGPEQQAEFSRSTAPAGYPVSFPPDDLQPYSIDTLGGLRTDVASRLTVLGGHGRSGSTRQPPAIVDYANNDDWWDDTSDGPVTARIVFTDGTVHEVDVPAWVIVAPPRYAPELLNLVTLWDTMYDIAVRHMAYEPRMYADSLWRSDYRPSWEREIAPILARAHDYHWVVAIPPHPHDLDMDKLGDPDPAYNPLRDFYLSLFRAPDQPNQLTNATNGMTMMPYLCGDNCFKPFPVGSDYATVTSTQYFVLQQWAQGHFVRGGPAPEPTPADLDRAALDNCVGAAFSPGIEMTWICRNPLLYAAPFRLKHKAVTPTPLSLGADLAAGLEPGDVSRYMAVPWQADFNECSQQPVGERVFWWWPVQRPSFVHVEHGDHLRQVPWVGTDTDQNAPDYVQFADDLEMVSGWEGLGFVAKRGDGPDAPYVEVQRVPPRHRR